MYTLLGSGNGGGGALKEDLFYHDIEQNLYIAIYFQNICNPGPLKAISYCLLLTIFGQMRRS